MYLKVSIKEKVMDLDEIEIKKNEIFKKKKELEFKEKEIKQKKLEEGQTQQKIKKNVKKLIWSCWYIFIDNIKISPKINQKKMASLIDFLWNLWVFWRYALYGRFGGWVGFYWHNK